MKKLLFFFVNTKNHPKIPKHWKCIFHKKQRWIPKKKKALTDERRVTSVTGLSQRGAFWQIKCEHFFQKEVSNYFGSGVFFFFGAWNWIFSHFPHSHRNPPSSSSEPIRGWKPDASLPVYSIWNLIGSDYLKKTGESEPDISVVSTWRWPAMLSLNSEGKVDIHRNTKEPISVWPPPTKKIIK